VQNRPIVLNDPTGHEGVPPWINRVLDFLNPFKYDIVFVSARGALKNAVGVEGDITIYADLKPLKEKGLRGLDETRISINTEGALSLGISENLRGAVVIGSTTTDIDDIAGVSLVGKDGYSGNIAGCYHICLGYLPGVDKNLKEKSKAFLGGWGEGWDISVNLVEISDYILKGDPAKNKLSLKLPVANKEFIEKLPVVGPAYKKYFDE
jgi:hypothetical protein